MTRRPYEPAEIDGDGTDLDRAAGELERYAALTATAAPGDLGDRVMAAVGHEPVPQRGLLGWLLPASSGRGLGRVARAGAVAATLVLAVAGAMFAGELAQFVRDVGSGATHTQSPTPSVIESSSERPSESPDESPSGSPDASQDESSSPAQSGSPQTSEPGSAQPTAIETPGESETPRPATASPSPSPTA